MFSLQDCFFLVEVTWSKIRPLTVATISYLSLTGHGPDPPLSKGHMADKLLIIGVTRCCYLQKPQLFKEN